MCLNNLFFDEKKIRKDRWDKYGLSIAEAEQALSTIDSTIDDIAAEVMLYIEQNWTVEKTSRLKEIPETLHLYMMDSL